MIGDDGNSRFMGFGLLGLWVFGCLIFFFFVRFGCDCGLWLKRQFGGCVGGGLIFFFFFSCRGLCWVMVVVVLVVVT